MHEPDSNEIVLRDTGGAWLHFRNPRKVLRAMRRDEVLPLLDDVSGCGMWAAGYIAYEAAPAFDASLPSQADGGPLAWFGIYSEPERIDRLPPAQCADIAWVCDTSIASYYQQIAIIKNQIRAGNTYQVNHTVRLRGVIEDRWGFFRGRMADAEFSGYIRGEDQVICSASPELFFEVRNDTITCRPMKGTARAAAELESSVKDRAENIMIVDMIRNDLGRVCRPGSIIAEPLFEVVPCGCIRQMISTVRGKTDASLTEIFKALFPCASITGAPKHRTMQIIAAIEDSPRGVYCGAIGYVAPGRRARFSVAIRTAAIDCKTGRAVYGAGGGIVWDSRPEAEWRECAMKAEVLGRGADRAFQGDDGGGYDDDFQLLETMLFDNGTVQYRDEHIERLCASAAQLGFALDQGELRRRIDAIAGERLRLRLLLARDGTLTLSSDPFPAADDSVRRVCLARAPVDPDNLFLLHKTTRRQIYDRAMADFPGMDDVILWNARGEITESTVANIVVRLDGNLVTPPLQCGVLPGTMRAALLKQGSIDERIITRDELTNAEDFYLINSLRGWMKARMCAAPPRI